MVLEETPGYAQGSPLCLEDIQPPELPAAMSAVAAQVCRDMARELLAQQRPGPAVVGESPVTSFFRPEALRRVMGMGPQQMRQLVRDFVRVSGWEGGPAVLPHVSGWA